MRSCATAMAIACLCACTSLAGEQTVRQFLAHPPVGDVLRQDEVTGRVSVQKTGGLHKGHRIVLADVALCDPEKKPDASVLQYALRYNACLEVDKHPGAVDLTAKEGMSGVGMIGPTGQNWYAGGFIDVVVNGQGLGNHRPRLTRAVDRSGVVALFAAWTVPWGKVVLTFLQVPGEDFCRVIGEVDCPGAASVEVRLRCYPCITKPTGQRVAWTASQYLERRGKLLAGLNDSWFLAADMLHDRAKSKRGAGPCAVMFVPCELTTASLSLTPYSVAIRLLIRPDQKTLHLALWEFKGWSNERALKHLRDHSKGLRVEMGQAATAAVRTENVPPRAIVVDRQPAATILLGTKPNEREVRAAVDIQDYVGRATGAVLPIARGPGDVRGHVIAIRVQDPPQGESREAFRIKVTDRRTDLVGNSPLAAFYAACELLERGVGVRWYLPGPLGEVVPRRDTLVLPALDLEQSPSFPMRWIGNSDWMLRNKQNRCDDGFLVYPGIYHTQNRLVPHQDYFQKRPDFFALIKGERSPQGECKLCYSNPDLVREVAKNMGAMLDANPNIKLMSLSPTDGQMWCECEGCKGMDEEGVDRDRSKSRRSLLFYNAVAAELRKTHPEARMLVGAYNVYNWPPKDKAIKADPMIDVIITHYEDYCMAHPVPDPACPLNQRYVQLIKEWQELGCGIYYYEYYWKVNWLDLPWPIVHSIRHDFPWYKQQGHKGVYTQYSFSCVWQQFPVHYVAAKLLWDVNADVDAIMDRMFDDLFAAAAPQMKAYWALMEKQTATCGRHFPGRGLSVGPAVFTDSVRGQLRSLYEAAVEANQDKVVAQRLEKIGSSLEYVDRLMQYGALKRATTSEPDPAKALATAREALEHGEALVNEIRRDRKRWDGVVSMSVVGSKHYLGRDVERWAKVVSRKKALTVKTVAPLPKIWKFALDRGDVGQKESWFRPGFDDRAWKPIQIGRTWESQGYEYDGFAWYRVEFLVRKEWLKPRLAVHFGAVDGEAWVYWNGTLLGHHKGWDEPFSFNLAPELISTDKPNIIAVRVYDGANDGGIYKTAYLVEAD